MKRPTIKDVARVAGVTFPTVSRVLGNKPYVSAETRERVLKAVDELGYRPSAAARSMVTSRTETIALLVPQLKDPNFGMIIAGADGEARRRGYSVLVAGFAPRGDEVRFLSEHRVDGVVLVEPFHWALNGTGLDAIPAVSLDDVAIDNRGGGRDLAAHLFTLGHRRVAALGGPLDSPYARDRVSGLRDLYPEAPWLDGDWTAEGGYRLAGRLLADHRGRAFPFTALLAANDFVAIGAIHALREAGLGVPEDVSVTGFDDVALARHFDPPLTTVAQDLENQGARAVALLLDRLAGREAVLPPVTHLPLIQRRSTGPAPQRPAEPQPPTPGRTAPRGVNKEEDV